MILTIKCKLHLMMINHKMVLMNKKNSLFNPIVTKIKLVNLITVQKIVKIQIITNLIINRIMVRVIVKKIILKILKTKILMEIIHRIRMVKIKAQTTRRVKVMVKVLRKIHFYLNLVIELPMKIQIYNIIKTIKRNNKKTLFKISPFLKMRLMILFIKIIVNQTIVQSIMMIIKMINSKKIINNDLLVTITIIMAQIEMVKEINFKKIMNKKIQIILITAILIMMVKITNFKQMMNKNLKTTSTTVLIETVKEINFKKTTNKDL